MNFSDLVSGSFKIANRLALVKAANDAEKGRAGLEEDGIRARHRKVSIHKALRMSSHEQKARVVRQRARLVSHPLSPQCLMSWQAAGRRMSFHGGLACDMT